MKTLGGNGAIGFKLRARDARVVALALIFFGACVGACHRQPSARFTQVSDARRLAADLRAQFNKASDASDRAVLADTDEASVAFAREADKLKEVVKNDDVDLEARLRDLGNAPELEALATFERTFAEYEKVDRDILLLAIENSNLKAQRLSFGPARDEADAFRDALQAAVATVTRDRCGLDAVLAKGVLAVREIQILQAPHIAEADDAVMTRLEKEMAVREERARDATKALAGLVDAKGKASMTAAVDALDKFAGISKEIVKLSRRNSNVRSLALSLRGKPALTAGCDDSLRLLQEALAKEAFTATR
ncbi:MAG: hypothetical protein JWM82_4337 [Myxococcales bacterium]|nr:hypothetical protein [Myxococcales bacterium]